MDSNYQTPSSNFTVTHSDDGATMICSATSGTQNRYTKLNNSINWRDSNTNYQIECDFEFDNGSNGGGASVIFGNARIGLSFIVGGTATGSGHLTIVSSGDTYIVKLNGTQVGSRQNMTNSAGFGFVFYRNVTIKFKDLVIYTI